ncbi:polyketide cyclase/dehydrase/lipid transport protein [Tamaricihabitans halophyticus]|uniref:Polyketide cyclase/dehydrase/lipid transport protein n=1 Tax=Tamaricihabitans halophyticus TaxID=1262583 RepID=A0A4R2QIG8_9PSEU|nr:SRPBCC family protein [Tamaricihabitans halophyticus]TCP46781.1 polyketide cyclase/dehydrase/lipid transport protein [Tamaricihabitans halophyticus]
MSELTYQESIVVACSPEKLYDLVSDVTRTGEWSPVCKECWWDEGAGPYAGAWFNGRNEEPGRTWETRSKVLVAERGKEFTWVVNGNLVRWSYTLEPVDDATRLTESWEFLPAGLEFFDEKFGDDAPNQVQHRIRSARTGIPATLAAIKGIAERE